MASSSKSTKPYAVFLSFRGEVRNNFVGHLYKALVQNGKHTFRDREELRKGDNISMLMKAIEESCIAIVIFSLDYASSWWCLEEVAKIMECKKQKNLTVLPVFYKVDPKEVREGRASYAKGLAKHESKHGKDSKEMKRWKEALWDAGSLSGWTFNDGDDESNLIQEIVKDISTRLSQTPLHVAEHPVGIESRVVKLISMLNLKSKDDVLMVGLWGQGGIGKTTLGKAIFNDISKQFDGSSFLANVRETSKDCKGLSTLQEQLLNDVLLSQERLVVSDVARGIPLIQARLCHKRVLVILDDVDDLQQLHALARKAWFGKGSRILFTTRDSHFLTFPEVDHMYEIRALGKSAAHEMLMKHAFSSCQELKIRTDLVDGVVDHAKGLPLALELLGCFLRGRGEDEWESTLHEISTAPMKDINDVLKISYHGLGKNEKDIFLHIACFFKGWEVEYIEKVLNSCDLKAAKGLPILIERSLIRVESGIIQMHDLIQLMGMDIVNQECDDPRRRSRLWVYEDILDILSCNVGDCAVKAIVLEPPELKEICIDPDAFTRMKRLRLLIMRNVSFQGPICLPNGLRWFRWAGCASLVPEFSSGPKKLEGLDMRDGKIPVVAEQFKGFQQLKYIILSNCKSLVRMPDLSCTPNLEELDLKHCKNLVEAHESMAYHDKLQTLDLRWCFKLSGFPNVLKSKKLRALGLNKCIELQRFPDIPCKLDCLKELDLQTTSIEELPASIENFVSLEILYLTNCEKLVSLPSSIQKLQNLKELGLEGCIEFIRFPKLEDLSDPCIKSGLSNLRKLNLKYCNLSEVEFLENLSCCPLLQWLSLYGNNIASLPTSIHKRHHLSFLGVSRCHRLREIPKLPPFLRSFEAKNCYSLQKSGHLTSFDHFVRRRLTVADISSLGQESYSILLPGWQMPKWVLPVEGDSISFMASEDLYRKFLGLALCFVLTRNCIEEEVILEIERHVNGESRGLLEKTYLYVDTSHIYIDYFVPHFLWGKVNFGQIEGSYVKFSLTMSRIRNVKEWGFRIICKPLEDDLKMEIQNKELMDLTLLKEVDIKSTHSEGEISKSVDSEAEILGSADSEAEILGSADSEAEIQESADSEAEIQESRDSECEISEATDSEGEISESIVSKATDSEVEISKGTDSEAEISIMHEDSSSGADAQKDLQDWQVGTEERSQIVPKRNHEFILTRGMRTKTMLTSNSISEGEHGGVGLQLLLLE